MSFGATMYYAPESINDTFMRAKDALSEAKNCGMNKIVISELAS
jgi:GGDEF domain-containing protein